MAQDKVQFPIPTVGNHISFMAFSVPGCACTSTEEYVGPSVQNALFSSGEVTKV